jgi:hypothetical protein
MDVHIKSDVIFSSSFMNSCCLSLLLNDGIYFHFYLFCNIDLVVLFLI